MNKAEPERKKSARFSFKNLLLWIVCFFIAYGLWWYVKINESDGFTETYGNVPVTLTHKDELGERGLSLYSGEGNVISVKLSGKHSNLPKSYETDKITAYVDLNQVTKTGQMELEVKVKPPDGCAVVSQSMKTIFVDVDEQMSVNLDVKPIWLNDTDLPEDCFFEYSMKQLASNAVTVAGPKQEVVKVQSVNLRVDLAGVQRTETVVGEVELLDENGELFESTKITYSPKQISVKVPVNKEQEAEVEVRYEDGFLNATNSTFKAEPSTVMLTGDRDAMEQGVLLSPVKVDESDAFKNGDSEYRATVVLETAENVTVVPPEVEIVVTPDPALTTRWFSISSERIIDDTSAEIKEKYDYMWESKMVDVTLMGYPDILYGIEEEDLELHLDMASYINLSDTKYTVELTVKIPSLSDGAVLVLEVSGVKVIRDDG